MSISAEAKKEAGRLLRQNGKTAAIKYLCDMFGVSLEESKLLVEALEIETGTQPGVSPDAGFAMALTGELKTEVIHLLQDRKKIDAVKRVKQALNTGLKEAMVMVEEVDKETNPNYKAYAPGTGCLTGAFKVLSYISGIFGVISLALAILVYYYQTNQINQSERVNGKVIELRYEPGVGAAPVIAFTWKGEQKTFTETFYSDPPAYEIDEQVGLFVNRENPDEVIIDTLSDRWVAVMVFGIIAAIFLFFMTIFIFIRRKF
jgi:ribosomal protein L7/L12